MPNTPPPAVQAAPLYTVDQANRALPYVRRVVEDLVHVHAEWRLALVALEAPGAVGDPAGDVVAARRRVAHLAADVQAALAELAMLGVECKGLDVGLVDFPAEVDGAPAYLCWQLGEPAVAWWHRPDAGFAGRRPIDAAALGAVAPDAGAPDAATAAVRP